MNVKMLIFNIQNYKYFCAINEPNSIILFIYFLRYELHNLC